MNHDIVVREVQVLDGSVPSAHITSVAQAERSEATRLNSSQECTQVTRGVIAVTCETNGDEARHLFAAGGRLIGVA